MNMGINQRLSFQCSILLLALVPLTVLAGKSVDKRWDVAANVKVSVENIAGSIVIQGWDKNEVQLTGELGDSVAELKINASQSAVQITVVNQKKQRVDNTKLRLSIPQTANIDASAVSADIEITGLHNEKLTATSVSGDVKIEAQSQWVSIDSVSGDVEFSGATTRISAESVSGDLDLSGVAGEITATTVSGDMNLQAGEIARGKFETVSGDITLGGSLAGDSKLTAESMSGDVTIGLPASQSGHFKAQSFSGWINTDFGTVEHSKHGPGSRLDHVIGSTGAEIRVESFSGNIKLQRD